MISLTRKQHELLGFLRATIDDSNGVAPSFDEMREALGLASKSGVHRLLAALEERGLIRRLPNRARAIEVVNAPNVSLALFTTSALVAELERRGAA